MIDLHMHSTASDGTDEPVQLVTKCKKLGLEVSSITDHDTIDAQEDAVKTAKECGIRYLPGVEFSVRHDGELHILGYGIDILDNDLQKELEDLRASRMERIDLILKKLDENHLHISKEDVIRNASGKTLGRPHVALAMIEKGYVQDFAEAFKKYLNEEGLCYVKRRKLTPKDAIQMIQASGGTAVLAHPKFIHTNDLESLVLEMKEMGLEGLEAFYPAHTDSEVQRYEGIAKRQNILVTGGSDYHGAMRLHSAIASERRTSKYLKESVRKLMEKYL